MSLALAAFTFSFSTLHGKLDGKFGSVTGGTVQLQLAYIGQNYGDRNGQEQVHL